LNIPAIITNTNATDEGHCFSTAAPRCLCRGLLGWRSKGNCCQKTRESMVKMVKYPPLISVKPFKSRLIFDHFLNSELLNISYDLQDVFEECLSDDCKTFLHVLRVVEDA
jgi:hypothetical protein